MKDICEICGVDRKAEPCDIGEHEYFEDRNCCGICMNLVPDEERNDISFVGICSNCLAKHEPKE